MKKVTTYISSGINATVKLYIDILWSLSKLLFSEVNKTFKEQIHSHHQLKPIFFGWILLLNSAQALESNLSLNQLRSHLVWPTSAATPPPLPPAAAATTAASALEAFQVNPQVTKIPANLSKRIPRY